MLPMPPLLDVCSGNIWQQPDANGATATTPGYGEPPAAQPGPGATTTGGSPAHSGGSESPAGFEGRQAAPPLGQAFFQRLHGDRPCPQHRQQGQGPHGQGDVPVPPRPAPDFVVIQPD